MNGPIARLLSAWNGWLDSHNPYRPEAVASTGTRAIELDDGPLRRRLSTLVTVAFAAFLGWALFAPIDAGVTLRGTVVVLGHRKAIQHPAGGVVDRILVREGSSVEQGEVLVNINPLSTQASLSAAELDYINALATESRLLAEQTGRAIAWLPTLESMADAPRVIEAKARQMGLAESRRQDLLGQKRILQEQTAGASRQLEQTREIIAARQQQWRLLSEEAQEMRQLSQEGFVPRSKASATERERNETQASLAAGHGEVSRLLANVAANRLQIAQLDMAFRKEVDAQLSEVQKNRLALLDKVEALRFDLALTELRAPVAGTVVNLKLTTEGGVIQPGLVLMEIVPAHSGLIIEARVPPSAIDKVRAGLETDLRFTAFNQTTTPVVPGRVKLVGADRIEPADGQGEAYYLAQVETAPGAGARLGDAAIQPGMPVDVIVKTGARSFMSYLVKPITDRFALAFKES